MSRLRKLMASVAIVVAGLFGVSAVLAPPAEAYSNLCITHFSKMPGPGGSYYRHTVGNFVSGTYYKIVIVEKLAPAGYWYVYDSFRRYCG